MGFFSDLFGSKPVKEEPKPDLPADRIRAIREGGTASLSAAELLSAEFPLEEQIKELSEGAAGYFRDFYEECESGGRGQEVREYDQEALEKDVTAIRERLDMIRKSCAFSDFFDETYDKVAEFVDKLEVLSDSAKSDEEIYMMLAIDSITSMIHNYSGSYVLDWFSARMKREGMGLRDRQTAVSRIGAVLDRINEEKLRLLDGDLTDSKVVADKLYLSAISTALGAAYEPNTTRYLSRNGVSFGQDFADFFYEKAVDLDDSYERMIVVLYKGLRSIRREMAEKLPEEFRK